MKSAFIISSVLCVVIFHLFLVSADRLSLPMNETASVGEYSYDNGRCGNQGGGAKCPDGFCCSKWGWCGKSSDYCAKEFCQSQCPRRYPQGSCGWMAGGRNCSIGICCSKAGWCGTTSAYCDPKNCYSQCKIPSSPPPPPPSYPKGSCGDRAAGRKCPTGLCCSASGWCGTTSDYCDPEKCQSQCKTTITSSFQNPIKSFYFNLV